MQINPGFESMSLGHSEYGKIHKGSIYCTAVGFDCIRLLNDFCCCFELIKFQSVLRCWRSHLCLIFIQGKPFSLPHTLLSFTFVCHGKLDWRYIPDETHLKAFYSLFAPVSVFVASILSCCYQVTSFPDTERVKRMWLFLILSSSQPPTYQTY